MNKKMLEIQKRIGAITKDSKNPFYKSKYFDINKLLSEVKPILSELGIILLQPLSISGGMSTIKTILRDSESGEEISSETLLPLGISKEQMAKQNNNIPYCSDDPQKMGSIITYYRRYSLQSLLGLEADDDDGNHGSGHSAPKHQETKPAAKYPTAPKQNVDLSDKKGEIAEILVNDIPEMLIKKRMFEFEERMDNVQSFTELESIRNEVLDIKNDNIEIYRGKVKQGLDYLAGKAIDKFDDNIRRNRSVLSHLGDKGLQTDDLNALYKYYSHLREKAGQ